MKINAVMRMAALCLLVGSPAMAELKRVVSELHSGHAIAAHWESTLDAKGAAYMVYDPEKGRIIELVMQIDGITSEDLASAGPEGAFGAIHIHNYPQGGPDFFILQLPGEVAQIAGGVEFRLEDWQIEAPLGRKHDGIDAAFVLAEIAKGNAYFGFHTHDRARPRNQKPSMVAAGAAPGTALSRPPSPRPTPQAPPPRRSRP